MTQEQLDHLLSAANRTLKQLIDMPYRDFVLYGAELVSKKRWSMREFAAAQKIKEKYNPVAKKQDVGVVVDDMVNVAEEAAIAFPKPSLDAQNSFIERSDGEKVQESGIDKARAYIAKKADTKVQFVFEILADGRPHHKRDIFQAMREKGWTDEHDLRKYVSDIRDYLAFAASHYEIPDCPPGKPAIYQLRLRK